MLRFLDLRSQAALVSEGQHVDDTCGWCEHMGLAQRAPLITRKALASLHLGVKKNTRKPLRLCVSFAGFAWEKTPEKPMCLCCSAFFVRKNMKSKAQHSKAFAPPLRLCVKKTLENFCDSFAVFAWNNTRGKESWRNDEPCRCDATKLQNMTKPTNKKNPTNSKLAGFLDWIIAVND